MPRGLSRPKRGGRRSLEAIITTHAPRTGHQDDTHTLHRSRILVPRHTTPLCSALVIRVNDDGIYALSLHYGIEYTNQPLYCSGGWLLFSVKRRVIPPQKAPCIYILSTTRGFGISTTRGWHGEVGFVRNVLAIHVNGSDGEHALHDPSLLPYKAMCRAASVSHPRLTAQLPNTTSR